MNARRHRASPGHTYDPCDGCGKADGQRKKGVVCTKCQLKLKGYDEMTARMQEGKVALLLPDFDGIGFLSHFRENQHTSSLDRTDDAFLTLMRAIGDQPPEGPWRNPDIGSLELDTRVLDAVYPNPKSERRTGWKRIVIVPERVAQAFVETITAIREDFEEIRDRSFANGSNLLTAMAEGRLGVKEINDAQQRGDRKGRDY